ncbi:dihydroxyacetone kinase phosphoryl donor subunit DhaM [Saccharomonospora viridis]|jgi:PTS hybrid protein|uniref:Phosphocarrier protein HPr n=2 Tax=Saccharomonospora viridis TaxID=1852 RepID=C7MWZ7_SACVD|nr:dihydroxyacetone kinase phosphoryl donor subunit DhaM [Saccharomonospora viridis]ACU97914.1 Phosphocarrier protein HPr/PTS system IIA component [Saccharomonospora viridis DSM 43017]KHF45881.1 PTS sugar transporter subunit IIA [Saccharomonospora viridis]SFP40402.1 PTS hybrid protein [Saccharomonospora viridis]
MRVGLVLVSHSAKLAEGLAEVAEQMAPNVTVLPAGGTPDGGIGTDYDSVVSAVRQADGGAGVVVLYDLGSAQMTAELVVESLDDPGAAVVVDAPLVEGAVAAAVAAQGGADRAGVAQAAIDAGRGAEQREAPIAEAAEETASDVVRTELTLRNEIGLHARPAALLVRAIAGVEADVRLRFGDDEADGHSVLAIMSLGARQGDRIGVEATGPQAREAIDRIEALVERNFEEG